MMLIEPSEKVHYLNTQYFYWHLVSKFTDVLRGDHSAKYYELFDFDWFWHLRNYRILRCTITSSWLKSSDLSNVTGLWITKFSLSGGKTRSILLYVIIMSRTSFRVNPHTIVCLNVKELFARSRRHIWSLSDSNAIRTHNHLVRKRTLNHLAKCLSVCLRTKWLWVRIALLRSILLADW